jgi:hypothetical protein
LRALQQLFEVPSDALEREDPWWMYHVFQGRNVDELLEALRHPFLAERQQ